MKRIRLVTLPTRGKHKPTPIPNDVPVQRDRTAQTISFEELELKHASRVFLEAIRYWFSLKEEKQPKEFKAFMAKFCNKHDIPNAMPTDDKAIVRFAIEDWYGELSLSKDTDTFRQSYVYATNLRDLISLLKALKFPLRQPIFRLGEVAQN